jgi:hypothetical protein
LVESRQDWRQVHYRLADGVSDLLAANDRFIERVAERVAACTRPEMLASAAGAREGGDHGDAG